MNLHSWGRYPQHQSEVIFADNEDDLSASLADDKSIICYGNGRSYGDSALNSRILYRKNNNLLLSFEHETGILHCQAGVLLSEILDVFTNKGWFFAVTPGTKFVTVGGAISSDVHGKNQHIVGSFCDYLLSFRLTLADGNVVECSRTTNHEIFKAACGGMGLVGVILDATIQLKSIPSSFMEQITLRTNNLTETLEIFENNLDSSYSVAWIDCFAKDQRLGRAVINLAEHADNNNYSWNAKKSFSLPFYFSGLLLNKYTGRVFNALYYQINKGRETKQLVDINKFFYPLDGIDNWNRLYGKGGFIQYQFVIPKEHGLEGLTEILIAISGYRHGGLLAVLKLFGKGNENYLSFPMQGYTLAVDFKVVPELFAFLDVLDKIVLKFSGRFYLAKDSRLSREVFEVGYPEIDKFRKLREKYALTDKFQSFQSKRLAL